MCLTLLRLNIMKTYFCILGVCVWHQVYRVCLHIQDLPWWKRFLDGRCKTQKSNYVNIILKWTISCFITCNNVFITLLLYYNHICTQFWFECAKMFSNEAMLRVYLGMCISQKEYIYRQSIFTERVYSLKENIHWKSIFHRMCHSSGVCSPGCIWWLCMLSESNTVR